MPTLAAIGAAISTTTVVIRGVTLNVTRLSIAQQDAIDRAIPLPVAPIGPDRTKGSEAPPVPDYESPAYRAASRTRMTKLGIAEACAALGLSLGDGSIGVPASPSDQAAWAKYCEAAWDDVAVKGRLLDYEVNAVHKAMAEMTDQRMREAARGNSPAAPAATPGSGSI